jgi:secreted trypsin-like serine protease
MIRSVLLFSLLAQKASAIYKGTNVSLGTYPNFATILWFDSTGNEYICGGWLADSRHVVTAAHCVGDTSGAVNSASKFYIYFNKIYTGVTLQPAPSYVAQALFIHPSYNAATEGHDVGIARIAIDVSGITPWAYTKTDAVAAAAECTMYTAIGHGQTCSGGCISDMLQLTTLPKLNTKDCETTASTTDGALWDPAVVVSDACLGHLPPCSGGYSIAVSHVCSGDSGGPIFDSSNTVVALVSRGSAKPCSQELKADVMTDIGVPANAAWIASVLASVNSPMPPSPPPSSSGGTSYYMVSTAPMLRVHTLLMILVVLTAVM